MISAEEHVRLMLALLSLKRVGPVTAKALASRVTEAFGDPGELADFLSNLDHRPRGFTHVGATEMDAAFRAADERIERCAELQIGIASERTSPFCAATWCIPKPPAILYYKGNAKCAEPSGVAIIGTREPTDWGYKSGERIATRCSERGFTVVSGLAVGCDTSAHEGALAATGATIAVLAHGLDTVYPAANRKLAERMLAAGGMLVSEYPPGTELRANQLVERDRLQSALSRAVIVVETDVKGGTMHTVGFASDQGRRLAALAHPDRLLHEPKAQGNQQLIRTGKAIPLPDNDALNAFLDALAPSPPVAMPAAPIPENLFDAGG